MSDPARYKHHSFRLSISPAIRGRVSPFAASESTIAKIYVDLTSSFFQRIAWFIAAPRDWISWDTNEPPLLDRDEALVEDEIRAPKLTVRAKVTATPYGRLDTLHENTDWDDPESVAAFEKAACDAIAARLGQEGLAAIVRPATSWSVR